jgi:hypothetical protein
MAKRTGKEPKAPLKNYVDDFFNDNLNSGRVSGRTHVSMQSDFQWYVALEDWDYVHYAWNDYTYEPHKMDEGRLH